MTCDGKWIGGCINIYIDVVHKISELESKSEWNEFDYKGFLTKVEAKTKKILLFLFVT